MRIPRPLLARPLLALPLLLAAGPSLPLTPGAWQETLVYALDSVNGSEEIAAHMASALPNPAPRQSCLTASDITHPQTIFLAGAEQSCRFGRFTMADGKITADGECSDGHGQTMHVSGAGTYSPTTYDFSFTGTGQAGRLALAFRGRDSGRRIGVCNAF